MPIKTTIRYLFTPTQMANIKKQTVTSVDTDVEKSKLSCIVGGNVK